MEHTLNEQRKEYIGKRVRLILMKDDNPVPPGTEGTIIGVDDLRTIQVKWDNGRTLGLIPDVDQFEFI